MRNCFFYYIYFLCKLQYNFHVIHFFVKITNHCLFLFVIFHIKHQSFPLRALSSSGYSQSASLRSSTPNNCSAVYQLNPVSGKPCYNLWSDFITKACLCRSDQEKTLSEHLNFYLIFIVYFYYSLPPDVAIPSMNCFWKIRYSTIIGIHASRDAAISCG